MAWDIGFMDASEEFISRLIADMGTEATAIWLDTPHDSLDGRTPRQALDDGDTQPILAIVTRLENDAFA
ncbi:MAG TPA: hypothetical protein VGK17_06945 [Propionicimonas sp.]|jgi:hypothetical protein